MRYALLFVLATSAYGQPQITITDWQVTGRIDGVVHTFIRSQSGDSTAIEIYYRDPFKLMRIDLQIGGDCYWSIPDSHGRLRLTESHWILDPCRDFYYSARLFDDGRMLEPDTVKTLF